MSAETTTLAPAPCAAELLSAFAIAEVCQVSTRAVRKRLDELAAPKEKDARGLTAWRESYLPPDWQHRIALAKRIKGCDTVEELLFCRSHAAARFEYTIDQATDHEKKIWPHRKAAILEYYRAVENGCQKGEAETRACAVFLRESRMPAVPRKIRRWLKPVEKCGGPQHAPDEAYVLWGKRGTRTNVPAATIEYFNTLVVQNQRKFAPAWKKLVEQLRNWRATGSRDFAIPGYTTPPLNAPGSDLPPHWSYKFFIDKKRRPSLAVIAGARYGLAAVKSLAPTVRKTRVGVKVGEIFFFDDQVYDVKVNVLGINTRATRPLGLDVHDRASDCTFKSFFKPTVWDDENRAKEMIRSHDMLWFTVCVLRDVGYRNDERGTLFAVEHGTASLPKWFQDNLAIVTAGKVRVEDGSIGGAPAFGGQFSGPAKGCANFKAALESARNPLRNLMADMSVFPGATGMDRDHCPEDLYGRDIYNKMLLKAAAKIGVDLKYPFVEWRDFPTMATAYLEMFNRETEHACEGWVESGYTTQEWRMDHNAPWMSRADFYSMPADKQAALAAWLDSNPGLTRSRKLSRREVFERGQTELTRLPVWLVPQLLTHQDAPEYGIMRRVNENGEFAFTDEQADPYGGEFVYRARLVDRHGHQIRLTTGEKYKTFLNPLDPRELIVCLPNGAYLGCCPQVEVAPANDMRAITRLIGANRQHVAEAQSDLARLGAERTREIAAMRMHNEGAAAGPKPERKAQIEKATDAVASLYANH